MDKAGELMDKAGELMDKAGELIDKAGELIDKGTGAALTKSETSNFFDKVAKNDFVTKP